MDIQNLARVVRYEGGGEDPHKTGEQDRIGFVAIYQSDQCSIKCFFRIELLVIDDSRCDLGLSGSLQPFGAFFITDYRANFCINGTGIDRVDDGLQVGTTAGD